MQQTVGTPLAVLGWTVSGSFTIMHVAYILYTRWSHDTHASHMLVT